MSTPRISDHTLIPLSDGTQLSARIWFPEQDGCYPAIFEYHPYPKRYVTADRDEIGHAYFAAHGYVSVRVDMRGAGESEGFLSDEYTELARQDAVEVRRAICGAAIGVAGIVATVRRDLLEEDDHVGQGVEGGAARVDQVGGAGAVDVEGGADGRHGVGVSCVRC